MESSKYLIAGGTTNWVEGLAQYYAKDEEKRRRYGEQLRQRDAQALKVMEAQSPIKMLEKLSSFSQTLGKLSQQQKKLAQQNAETERSIANVLLTKNVKAEEWEEVNRIARESVNDLKFEGALFKKNINASKLLSPAAKKTLTAQHGSSIYRIHEQIGFRSLRDLDAAIEAYGATEAGKKENFQVKLDEVRASGDHIAEKEIYKRFAFKQFNELGFNDEFIATNFYKPLEKFVGTKGVMSQLMYERIHHTEQELDWDVRVDTAKDLYDNGDKFALTNEFHSQLVESNNNKDRIVTHYYRLGKSGKLNRDELRALREGDLDEKLGFKAGDKGEALLSKEQWAQIERGISENEAATVKGYKTGISQQALTTIATIYKGEASIEELTAMRDETLLTMQRAGLTNTDAYRELEGTDVTLQKPESYAAIREDNHDYFEGSLQSHRLKDKENFKATIKNGRVLKELNEKVAEDERYYRDVSLPTTHKDHVELAEKRLQSSPGQRRRISGLSQVIDDPEFTILSNEVALKRQEFHIIARKDNPGNNVRAYDQAEAAFQQWEIDNGINEIDDGNNPNAGILSPTNEGIYRISKERRAALRESSGTGTRSNVTQWGQDMSRAYTQSGGSKEKALNTPNTFTSHGDIQGVFLNADIDDQNNIKPYYSPEIIFKARALRIQPSQLILKQLQALKNGDHKDEDFYKRAGLKKYEEILKNDPAVKIEEALENLADNKLLFLWRNGVENMTANQITRLIDSLSGFKWHKALTETREIDETFGHTIRTFK